MTELNELYEWYQLTEQLVPMKAKELELRKKLFGEYFPEPVEGTNRVEIEGAELIAVLPYNYTIDPDDLDAALETVPASKRDQLITWKPSLAKKVYNSLSKKARTTFTTTCLTVKPGSPSLKIVPKD